MRRICNVTLGVRKETLNKMVVNRISYVALFFLTAIFMMDLSGALAQTTGQGALQGTITDSTDAVIPMQASERWTRQATWPQYA